MQRLRTSRATTPSRGFITRAASALIFIGATALAFALPGDAAERNTLTPSFSEWRESGSPAPAEESGHWLGADVGTFRITRGDALHDRIFRAVQDRVHQEPEKAAREVHSLVVGDAAGREKLRQMLLNAAEGKEMMTALDLDSWWQSYTDSYLLDLADAGVNEVLQYSEERMLARLGFVKNVNLEYRTPLGGRTGYGALSFLGALAEKEDSVVAWQLRASHNEDAESGLNAGLIFRHARDKFSEGDLFAGHPMLLGLNAFLDFETHKAANFLRYSVGGEIRTGALDFYGNYYIPLTDSKLYEADGDRGYYYSAEGFDVEANVGVPGADWLSGVVGYYWWEGQHGDNDEEGTKLGFRARPNTSWEFEFEYDHANEGDQEIGGRLSYTRQIGDQPSFNVSSRPFGGNFNPRNHFYDIVRREYAQRIRFAREQGGFVFHFGNVEFNPTGQGEFAGALEFQPSGEFPGYTLDIATYNASIASTVVIPRSVPVTVVMAVGGGSEIAIPVGRNAEEAVATIRFIAGASGSEYILEADQGGRAVSVISGALWWDDPISGGAHIPTAGAGGSDYIMLDGTGFSVTAGSSGSIGAFVLYEGKATPVTDSETDVLNCDQSSSEGRDRDPNFTTECYGDLATFANGANLALGGTPLEDNSDYPNSTEAQLIASGQAMLTMRGGRSNTENVEISFAGETTVDILNNVAGGVRYVKVKDGSFKIGAQDVSCDPGGKNENTILAYVGAVAGYCPDALSTFLQGDGGVPPVGIANNGFSSGVILTVTVPFNGVDMSFSLVGTVPAGISLDPESGVLSASAVTGLDDGVNEIQVLQEITAIPGVDLPESQNLVVEVHKLPSAFTQNVVIDEADAVLAFVDVDSERKIAMIGGLELENAVFSNVQAGDLAGSGVSYSAAGVFSLDSGALAESDIGVLGNLTVDVTADNIRGTHELVVKVEAVNILQIESQYQVPGNAVEAAILDGTTGRVTDLTPGVSDPSKVVLTYDTATEGAKVTPAGSG